MAFDHHDPYIQELMDRKGLAQTEALTNRRAVNHSPARMRAVARQHDPTAILDDDDRTLEAVERFIAGLDLPDGVEVEYVMSFGGRVDFYMLYTDPAPQSLT